jgi:hypothetical protein
MKDIATYLEQISGVDDKGVRRLPISSSPEMFDNSINAWFSDMTNFDTALMKFAFNAAGEMADSLSLADEAARGPAPHAGGATARSSRLFRLMPTARWP